MISNRQLFLQHLAPTSTAPLLLEIEKAEGLYLCDTKGRKIMDLISGIAVSNVGHTHPAVVQAVKDQAEKYFHLMVYGEVVQSPQVQFAKALTDLLPSALNSVYFTNSGAEATEGAMKLAKRVTGRTNFVHFKHAYHGSTQGALSILGDEYFRNNYRPLLPDCTMLPYGDAEALQEITERTAAVFIDPVQAESGITIPTNAYLQQLRKRCTEVGALLVLDEAQTAFGRCGRMFQMEESGITPDVLLLAKALGGGMPLGAFIASSELMIKLAKNPVLGHITTFGGHPVSCAAGLAALQVLQLENLMLEAEAKGALFETLLQHAEIRSVRRKGLMLAVEFDSFEINKKIIDRCLEQGVFTDWFLFASNCLRICPPLIISKSEIESACRVILNAVGEVTKRT
ncbi:MAG: aspartate aminotransferase family protein [Chitinophagales bacterium]